MKVIAFRDTVFPVVVAVVIIVSSPICVESDMCTISVPGLRPVRLSPPA